MITYLNKENLAFLVGLQKGISPEIFPFIFFKKYKYRQSKKKLRTLKCSWCSRCRINVDRSQRFFSPGTQMWALWPWVQEMTAVSSSLLKHWAFCIKGKIRQQREQNKLSTLLGRTLLQFLSLPDCFFERAGWMCLGNTGKCPGLWKSWTNWS